MIVEKATSQGELWRPVSHKLASSLPSEKVSKVKQTCEHNFTSRREGAGLTLILSNVLLLSGHCRRFGLMAIETIATNEHGPAPISSLR